MENVESKKERKLIWLLVATWVMAATLGLYRDWENEATQENDSTNFNMNVKDGKKQQ